MSFGFNSQVQVGGRLYDVQTEDRGLRHPFIDTVVLFRGQVLHRKSTSYSDLLASGTPEQETLQARVERQHQQVLESMRNGSLTL